MPPGRARFDVEGGQPWAQFRSHGDPFPLPSSKIHDLLERDGVEFSRRGLWTARSLNTLVMQVTNSDFDFLHKRPLTSPQEAVFDRIKMCLQEVGGQPLGLTGEKALEEMKSCKDLYAEEPHNLASYSYSKLKVLHTQLCPHELVNVLPPHAKALVSRMSTMIEKSPQEIACDHPCRIKPYWDPKLRHSKSEVVRLMVGLAQKGLVTFRTRIKERIGIFCVKKKTPEWNRMVIDARRVNYFHKTPPTTRLATPRSFLDIQFDRDMEGKPCAFGIEADVADCFYNFFHEPFASWFGVDCPMTRRQWEEAGWKTTQIFSDETQTFFWPSTEKVLFPVFRGLAMGWSWALFLANEAVAHIVCGRVPAPITEVRDRLPAPVMGDRAITGVYVDNISIIGKTAEQVTEAANRIQAYFDDINIPLTWNPSKPTSQLETVGIVLDFEAGVARNKPKRLWKVFLAGQSLMHRRRVSVDLLEVWLGHASYIFMLMPLGLSSFFHIYRFIHSQRGKRAELWDSVRQEIRVALGLIWLARSHIFDPIRQIDVGDASSGAYALLTTWGSRSEISESIRWRESWRFRAVPENLHKAVATSNPDVVASALNELASGEAAGENGMPLKPSHQFSAGLTTQFAQWLIEAGDPTSWLRTSSLKSHLRARKGKRVEVDVPSLVPPLDQRLCERNRYSLLWRKRWRIGDDHINVKEARVVLSSLKRSARVRKLHHKVKLRLTDNLVALNAFDRGRSGSFKLNRCCQSACAYVAATGIRWRLRHIETLRNPADHDSRFHEKKTIRKDKHIQVQSKINPIESKQPRHIPQPIDLRSSPQHSLPRSSSSVRGVDHHGSTASCGREDLGGGRIGEGPVRKTCQARHTESGKEEAGYAPSSSRKRRGMILELFSGTGRLSARLVHEGLGVLKAVDILNGSHHDLRRRETQLVILHWLKSGWVVYCHLGTPCTVFSKARHNIRHLERARQKERVGIELALFTAEVISVCRQHKILWSLENPRNSRLFGLIGLSQELYQPGVFVIDCDYCMFGEPFKKPTRIFTNVAVLRRLGRKCCHSRHSEVLRGSEIMTTDEGKRISVPKTRKAAEYPLKLVAVWARALTEIIEGCTTSGSTLTVLFNHDINNAGEKKKDCRKQIQTSTGWDAHVQRLEAQYPKGPQYVVFGQDTQETVRQKERWWGKHEPAFVSSSFIYP